MQFTCTLSALVLVAAASCRMPLGAQPVRSGLKVAVVDGSGAGIPHATVRLRSMASGREWTAETIGGGEYRFGAAVGGRHVLEAVAEGFSTVRRMWDGDVEVVRLQLEPATLAQEVFVSAGQVLGTPLELQRLPGSAALVSAEQLAESRVFTTDEALRKVAGVNTRGEEGFGLRPNIGVRGLNPTRSSRILLLEDGLPLSYAPYGDNASYYHPLVDRFQEIEVVKGGGQILYGPMTVGGVVNYLTPSIPSGRAGFVSLTGGSRDYANGHLQYGFNAGRTGFLLDAIRKQGEGARENLRHGISDFTGKTLTTFAANQTAGLRFNYYSEDSQLTYSGLRQDEWERFGPRYNPFANDRFRGDRLGLAGSHLWAPRSNIVLQTNAYRFAFERNWWRQSSNSAQRPNDAADPLCGSMLNLHTTCGNEGRLRRYHTWGVEPKIRASHRLLGLPGEADFGLRYHDELQQRVQKNGDTPLARDGVVVEDNRRRVRAGSGFIQNRFLFGRFALTPGVRLEHVRYHRANRLIPGTAGQTVLTQAIPGLGLAYSPRPAITLFAGAHRGFAPPRVEDVINNTTGASLDLDPELSWNYELGTRVHLNRDLQFEAALFRMDFANQVVPSSVAGGLGATLTNGGKTRHRGFEFSGRFGRRNLSGTRHGLAIRTAYTALPVAEYAGERLSAIPGFTRTRVTGHRLPYAPRHLLSASLHYSHAGGANAMIEGVCTGSQFGDDLNTVAPTADGQRGRLPGYAVWNATVNYPVESWRVMFFVTAKNLLDRVYIADRSRGLMPGMPRVIQAGVRYAF